MIGKFQMCCLWIPFTRSLKDRQDPKFDSDRISLIGMVGPEELQGDAAFAAQVGQFPNVLGTPLAALVEIDMNNNANLLVSI